ncbi:MAG: TetR/AcrR family transcriptional regulator [Deltaproteobacteria bacterium]|nr:TetR/AcrR family transcriptional regulator [Deltaproteobacteria bacterium]
MLRKPALRYRKRPLQARARVTVDAVLQATERVLIRRGVDGLTTKEVARLAGVSIGTLYQYFPDKHALCAAVLERENEEILRALQAALPDVARAPLPVLVRRVVETIHRRNLLQDALCRALIPLKAHLLTQTTADAGMAPFIGLVRSLIEARRAELRPGNADLMAYVVVHSMEAVLYMSALGGAGSVPPEVVVEEITRLVLGYLLPDAEEKGSLSGKARARA